ncbi:tyrosine recombinase [Porphyromonas catoniae]|uniref:Tyrosine recombinase XerC n=1 Tax=Porphyromonas catoniae ATCC 51270 TaxID=887901 RepID=Z4WUS8_9PORP|nr:tyrosine recombinase [Porphyromonas catoniae]EWC93043.1 site-specific recombinase, phage integrase family [Porphyromonas catoniae ATCC 51270]
MLPTDIRAKYLSYLRFELNLSANTCQAYLFDLDKLLSYLETEGLRIDDLDYPRLQHFVSTLYDLGISPNSISRIISGVKSFGRYLLLEGYLDTDPTALLEVPRKGRYLPTVLSTEEVDCMIEACGQKGGVEGARNRAIIEVLFSCGLRVSELCQLRFSDVFLDEGYLRVLGKGSKQRLVPLSPSAIQELTTYLTHPDRPKAKRGQEDYIFLSRIGKAISRITVFVFIKEAAQAAGVKKTISPHTFRHSFATALLEGGANLQAIQLLLGHEDVGTTEIYTHIDRTRLREQIERYHPRNQR